MKFTVPLATESHPSSDYHYSFTSECLDSMAAQAVGLPVTVNFSGMPIGRVVSAERTSVGLKLTAEIDDDSDVAQKVASPGFVAKDDEWNEDFTERKIKLADLKEIGMTDE